MFGKKKIVELQNELTSVKQDLAFERIGNKLLKEELKLKTDSCSQLQEENKNQTAYIEKKKAEEKKEIERMEQMNNFWSYTGFPQNTLEAGSEE